jgi:hypothetical protein
MSKFLFLHSKRSILSPISQVRCISKTSSNASDGGSLNFGDYQSMYQYKTNWELLRSLLILKACSINYFVDNSLTVKFNFYLVSLTIITILIYVKQLYSCLLLFNNLKGLSARTHIPNDSNPNT